MRERRAQKRFKRRFMVRYGERELTHSGFTSDISNGGAFIVAPQRPALDAHVHLHLFTDKETSVYFETTVRRHKIVPPQLRTLEKGGFGVRFRRPDEVLAEILFESGARLQVAYVTQDDLKLAYDEEFRHGGVFIPTEIRVERGSDVVVAVRLDFMNKTFEFDASVVQVFLDSSLHGLRGIGVIFKERKDVEETITPLLKPQA
jgi:Tfp pilus assembly protein PilZ